MGLRHIRLQNNNLLHFKKSQFEALLIASSKEFFFLQKKKEKIQLKQIKFVRTQWTTA